MSQKFLYRHKWGGHLNMFCIFWRSPTISASLIDHFEFWIMTEAACSQLLLFAFLLMLMYCSKHVCFMMMASDTFWSDCFVSLCTCLVCFIDYHFANVCACCESRKEEKCSCSLYFCDSESGPSTLGQQEWSVWQFYSLRNIHCCTVNILPHLYLHQPFTCATVFTLPIRGPPSWLPVI